MAKQYTYFLDRNIQAGLNILIEQQCRVAM